MHGNLIDTFDSHRGLCQSEENKCMWKHSKDGAMWQFRVIAMGEGTGRR